MFTYTPREEGEHYNGIPARDLTDDEYSMLTDEQKEQVVHGTLYDFPGKPGSEPQPGDDVIEVDLTSKRRRASSAVEMEASVSPAEGEGKE